MKNTNFNSSQNIIYLDLTNSSMNFGYVEDSARKDTLSYIIKKNTIILTSDLKKRISNKDKE